MKQPRYLRILPGIFLLIPVIGLGAQPTNNLPVVGTQYVVQNLSSDVVLVLNENGSVVSRLAYRDFGKLDSDNSSGTYLPRRTFTGQELDTSTALYYFNARYYDADVYRFLSTDSLNKDSSPYDFVAGSPHQYIDPTGQGWEEVMDPNNWTAR
ncbi:MAG: hypothetical protein DHS20C01_30410 [marine bacterium B5-7]|nr:MAG: hypothetical protein DHS20C01_30410 [marine bacterium B5-7]